jgi:gluconolactonase
VIADRHRDRRLNSPNDVVVASNGAVWFTDPTCWIMNDYERWAEPEQDGCHVYRVDPASEEVVQMADDFEKPNGLGLLPR